MTLPADVVLQRAQVWTMQPHTGPVAPGPSTGWVAVRGGRVAATGSGTPDRALIGPRTQLCDARGGAVLPGIEDSHLHLVALAMAHHGSLDVSAGASATWQEIYDRAATSPIGDDGWIRGVGWDDATLGGSRPDRASCDTRMASVGRSNVPMVLFDRTGHQAWCNTEALRRAGLMDATVTAPGGVIECDAHGLPTGRLRDGAMAWVGRVLPPVPEATLRRSVLATQNELFALGVTALAEPGLGPGAPGLLSATGTTDALLTLARYVEHDLIRLRLTVHLLFAGTGGTDTHHIERGLASGLHRRFDHLDPDRFRVAGVKIFADGIPRNGTAWMAEPYGSARVRGSMVVAGSDDRERIETLERIVALVHDEGLQVAAHATGDATSRAFIDAVTRAAARSPRDHRHYVVHGDYLTESDFRAMAELGMGWTTNPAVRHGAGHLVRTAVGSARHARQMALRSALRAGAMTSISSDAPVASADWRQTVVAAVTRCTRDGEPVPAELGERLRVAEALVASTRGAAWLHHAEARRGSIAPGMPADLVLLDGPIPPDERVSDLLETATLLTMVDGRVVHDRLA